MSQATDLGPAERAAFHAMTEGSAEDWRGIAAAAMALQQGLADRVLDPLRLLGGDRNLREQYRDHEWFDYTAEFCEKYDQCAFDPDYESEPLEHFEPMLRRVLAKPRAEWAGV